MSKLAVFFPGIGYSHDKPLLYYSYKYFKSIGYELIKVDYHTDTSLDIESFYKEAYRQTEKVLNDIDFNKYEEIIFISKSIGTVIASNYDHTYDLKARHYLFTPLSQTFEHSSGNAIAFHGTKDPWAKTDAIQNACKRLSIPLYLYENANHSLETGDIPKDIMICQEVMMIMMKDLEAYKGEIL